MMVMVMMMEDDDDNDDDDDDSIEFFFNKYSVSYLQSHLIIHLHSTASISS
jgi:hypothetical protein